MNEKMNVDNNNNNNNSEKLLKEKKISNFHFQLLNILKTSEVLKPLNIEVINESYWYYSRKRLGAKKHLKYIIQQNKSTLKYESYIYKMEVRKSDYEIIPQKILLKQDHDNKIEALKFCELNCIERDICPTNNPKININNINSEKLLNTHFRILIVSSKFERLNAIERLELIYDEILKIIGFNSINNIIIDKGSSKNNNNNNNNIVEENNSIVSTPYIPTYIKPDNTNNIPLNLTSPIYSINGMNSFNLMNSNNNSYFNNLLTNVYDYVPYYYYYTRCPPSSMKLTSTFGKNICNLSLFRYLLPTDKQIPFELLFDARTPSQWKPDIYPPPLSERFGSNHIDKRGSRLPIPSQKKSQMKRIKNMSTIKISDRDRLMADIQATKLMEENKKDNNNNNIDLLTPSSIIKNYGTDIDKIADSLGIDPFISGIKLKKTGGIFGHHFHDMSVDTKEKVLSTLMNSKKLIKSEGYHSHSTTTLLPDINLKNKHNNSNMSSNHLLKNEEFNNNNNNNNISIDDNNILLTERSSIPSSRDLNLSYNSLLSDKDNNIKSNRHNKKKKKLSVYESTADYDKGTTSENEMMTELFIRNKEIEKLAIRLQRIWRIRMFHRCIRYHWKKEYARITIQRIIRGHQTRMYYNLLKKIAPLACIRIQRSYRAYIANKILNRWRYTVYRMTRRILPWIKLFLKKCYMSWTKKHEHTATIIQSIVRMHLSRIKYYKILGNIYLSKKYYDNAITQLQRVLRGKWGRRKYEIIKQKVLILKIDQPCCLRLQRCYRGWIGRKLAKRRRYEIRATLKLQKNIRAFVWRIWNTQMKYEELKINSIIKIQKIVRGRLDRLLFQRMLYEYWYNTIYIPAILLVQSVSRMHSARIAYILKKKQKIAALIIQRGYKKLKERAARLARFRALLEQKRIKSSTIISKYIRRWLCIKHYKKALFARAGKRILAGKVIMRAWKYFIYSKRLQLLLDEHRLKLLTEKSIKMTKSRQDIMIDVLEIRQDIDYLLISIDRLKVRLKVVDTFLIESGIRIPQLQMNLVTITPEDLEKGWAEAYSQEYESLNHMSTMAREEKRLLKAYLLKKNRELLMLQCELEDTEIEADQIAVLELANFESLRRSEVGKIERRVIDKKNRALRIERCKWKIDSVRRNVIEKNRTNLPHLIKESQKDRNSKFAETVSFEMRQQQRDRENFILADMKYAEGRKVTVTNASYETYAEPVQETFDNVVATTLSLLRGLTLDERARRVKEHFKVADVAIKKSKGGQFSALKQENQKDKS